MYFEDIPDLRFNIELSGQLSDVRRCPPCVQLLPKGAFLGLSVDGRTVSFAENVFYKFRLLKIVSVWSIIDRVAIEAQLAR